MSANSEARKRAVEREPIWKQPTPRMNPVSVAASEPVRRKERRREVMRDALGEVWSGATLLDADAVLDHLSDLGASVQVTP